MILVEKRKADKPIEILPEDLLKQIFSTAKVKDYLNREYPLTASVDTEEGRLLQRLIRENKPGKSLEVGFANGIASLFICSALEEQVEKFHTVIDPNQSTEWKNVGAANLDRAGINFCRLMELPSEIALPDLHKFGERFQFAFIDGWHTFDHSLMDFFFIDKMLDINGIVVIDDTGMPSVNRVIRYILNNYPNYVYLDSVPLKKGKLSIRTIFSSGVKRFIGFVSKVLPVSLRYRFIAPEIIRTNRTLHLETSMIALKKTSEDKRSWDWFKDF